MASKRYGSVLLNIVRMLLATVLIGVMLWALTGSPIPSFTSGEVWLWLGLSALTGYIIGDYYFLKCFVLIGARWGELFMTVAPPVAALTGWLMLGEQMSWHGLVGMAITLCGISMSVLSRQDGSRQFELKLPLRAVVYGLIGGVGQGVGLVFSKQGMILYQEQLTAVAAPTDHLQMLMPFAATMIRCMVALVGFILMYMLFRRTGHQARSWRVILNDHQAFAYATVSTIAGPLLGVALALAATLYTTTGIAQTIMSLVPVLILWPSHLLFHQKITPLEVVGAIVSVCGVALFFL